MLSRWTPSLPRSRGSFSGERKSEQFSVDGPAFQRGLVIILVGVLPYDGDFEPAMQASPEQALGIGIERRGHDEDVRSCRDRFL